MTNTSLATVRVEIFPNYFIVWHGQRPTTVPYGQPDLLEAVILCRTGATGNADFGGGNRPPIGDGTNGGIVPIKARTFHTVKNPGNGGPSAPSTPSIPTPHGPPAIRAHLSFAQLKERATNGTKLKLPTTSAQPVSAFIGSSARPITPDF